VQRFAIGRGDIVARGLAIWGGSDYAGAMPELPEVETVRRALEPRVVGRRFKAVLLRRDDLRFRLPERFAERLRGRRVNALHRRAKFLLAELDSSDVLIVHLGMSGRIMISDPGGRRLPTAFMRARMADGAFRFGEAPHDHIVFDLDDGARIVFNDQRRFGMMDIASGPDPECHRLLAKLGPEPLGNQFTADYLGAALEDRRTPIKAALLDQRTVAGLGNIYVSEALFRAAISPRRLARTIPGVRAERLVTAIREVLLDAIAAGGSSLRDYIHTDGSLGYFQHAFDVYDRTNESCPRPGCRGRIRRIIQSGRSTFYCGRCQR